MAAIVNTALAGSTITYNGVQFGGSDAAFTSTPPIYSMQSTFVYDDAGRAVKYTRCILSVQSFFYATNEAGLGANVQAVLARLGAPGKLLKIDGIGLGFGTVRNDVLWGAKPLGVALTPAGELCWEAVFSIEFCYSPCFSAGQPLAFLAWNFDTTWANDWEGKTVRTIGGYVEIAQNRNPANENIVRNVVEQVRPNLTIIVPEGFKRTSNTWRENEAKNRLDFVVVDEHLDGEAYPAGMVVAQGSSGIDFGTSGFNEGTFTMNMSLKTAPGQPPALAGACFLQAAIQKQQNMVNSDRDLNVLPVHLSVRNHRFDGARITEGTISWALTRSFQSIFRAANIWQPLTDTDYTKWRTSIQHFWRNRGIADLESLPNEDLIVSLCNPVDSRTWGNGRATPTPNNYNLPRLSCYDVPSDGGWIKYYQTIKFRRVDGYTMHRQASLHSPGGSMASAKNSNGIVLGGSDYTHSSSESHGLEYHGKPEVEVLFQYQGLRLVHPPEFPIIESVGGYKAHQVEKFDEPVTLAWEAFGCPVYYGAGYVLYRLVEGPVKNVAKTGQKSMGYSDVPSTR